MLSISQVKRIGNNTEYCSESRGRIFFSILRAEHRAYTCQTHTLSLTYFTDPLYQTVSPSYPG